MPVNINRFIRPPSPVEINVIDSWLPPSRKQWLDLIKRISVEQCVTPWFVYSHIEHESGFGTELDKNGLGDNGNAYGFGQADIHYHRAWIEGSSDWKDPYRNLTYCYSKVLIPAYTRFITLSYYPPIAELCAIGAYNAGQDNVLKSPTNPQFFTYNRQYLDNVFSHLPAQYK